MGLTLKEVFIYQDDSNLSEENEWQMLACSCQTLIPGKTMYLIMELDAFRIVFAIDNYDHYLLSRHLMVTTYHHFSSYLHLTKDLCNKIYRQIIKLLEYNYTIVYKSRKIHLEPDCQSYYP